MNFLIDAHLPRRTVVWFKSFDCDAIRTLDLPNGNRSTDAHLIEVADRDQRVIVTKDADFVDSHLLQGEPAKLPLISTGNISNHDLEKLFAESIVAIRREFATCSFIELGTTGVVLRG